MLLEMMLVFQLEHGLVNLWLVEQLENWLVRSLVECLVKVLGMVLVSWLGMESGQLVGL